MILFLNKRDLFEEKIKKKPISCHFEHFKGTLIGKIAYFQII